MKRKQCLLLHFILLSVSPFVGIFHANTASAQTDDITFDTDLIRRRGFDPHIATQFQKEAQFPEGTNRVSLTLNGRPHGKVTAYFDANGSLCLTTSLLKEAGLRAPETLSLLTHSRCLNSAELWPQGEIKLRPDINTLEIVVPENAVSNQADYSDWEHGGTAGMLNYNGQYLTSQAPSNRFSFWQMQTETGFNTNDWIVRSNQNWTRSEDSLRFQHQSLWAERTLYNLKSRMRTGLFTLNGSTLGVGKILGVQMTPESALFSNTGVAVVSSIADTPSVIEIRQSGVLLYSTTVPSGPFTLSNFSLLDTHTDLQVTQTGSDGAHHQYSIPAAAYMTGGSRVTPGMSWGLGRWEQEGYQQHPVVASFSRGWQIFPRFGVQTDALYSSDYQAIGITGDIPLEAGGMSFSSIAMASGGQHGVMSAVSASASINENTSVSLNTTLRGIRYRDFSETMSKDEGGARNRAQYGPAISWYHELAGSFSLSWTRSEDSDGSHSDYAQLGWTRKAGHGYLSVTASRNNGGMNHRQEDTFYVSWQVPLGEKSSISSWINNRGNDTRYGTRFTRREGRDTSWNVAVDHSRNDDKNAFSAGVNQTTSWSQLSGNASYDSERYRSLSLQGSGSAVLYKYGAMFSPYRIEDTFAVVQAGRREGVIIDTTSGTVRTNRLGYAVVPSLKGWGTSTLQIDTSSLKKNTDVINGIEEISVARGAVREVNFSMVSTRRVLVKARSASGHSIPSRMGVYGDKNQFITVTSDDGTLFIPDARPNMGLVVSVSDDKACRLKLDGLPDRVPEDAGLYEITEATCLPDQEK